MKNAIITLTAATVLLLSVPAFAGGAGVAVASHAGSGDPGAGNNAALSATFRFPYGMAWDRDGGMIVVDSYNNLIRKVKDGKVTTIAGSSGEKDSAGLPVGGLVDGDAAKALFNRPRYAAVDSKGNIFVSDTGNHVIRKILGNKVYSFAGSGKAGYADASGINASFHFPSGMAMDKDDNLYVSDSLNNVIRKITPGGAVTTFAGRHSADGGFRDGPAREALFNEPAGLAIDGSGALYVLDSGNQRVRKIENGTVSTIAGAGGGRIAGTAYSQGGFEDGMAAKFNFPKGIDVAEDGTLFIADTWNNAIRAVKPDREVVTLAGTGLAGKADGPALGALFNMPTDVKYRSGDLYIADMWNNCIRVIHLGTDGLPPANRRSGLTEGIQFKPKSDAVQVWVDKQQVIFPDTQPYLENGKAFVPLRFICEAWGAEVRWDASKRQVEVIKDKAGRVFRLNSEGTALKGGRTMIHAGVLAERMGFYVLWVPEHNAVVISTGE